MYIKTEREYFAKRASLKLLVENLSNLFVEAAKVPWEFLPVHSLSVEDQKQMEQQQLLCLQQAEAMRSYLRLRVTRLGHGASVLTEVVSRPELPLTAALINGNTDRRSANNSQRGGIVRGGGRTGRGDRTCRGGKSIHSLTIPELKDLLKARDMKTSGSKAELIFRLSGTKNVDSLRQHTSTEVQLDIGEGTMLEDIPPDSNMPSLIPISGTKRVPCALGECEEFCSFADDVCQECPESERCYHYCSLHISHGSHSNQTSSKRRNTTAVESAAVEATLPTGEVEPATGRTVRASVHQATGATVAVVQAAEEGLTAAVQVALHVGKSPATVVAVAPVVSAALPAVRRTVLAAARVAQAIETPATVVTAEAAAAAAAIKAAGGELLGTITVPVPVVSAKVPAARTTIREVAAPAAEETPVVLVPAVLSGAVLATSATVISSNTSVLTIAGGELSASTTSYNATAFQHPTSECSITSPDPILRSTIEAISNILKVTIGLESVQKLHERIQSSILNERKKEDRHRNFYERLFSELDFAEYGRDLVYLNDNYYQCAVCNLAMDLSNNKNPLSKKKVRAEYLASFCRGYINHYITK